jgi:hypothetical protein
LPHYRKDQVIDLPFGMDSRDSMLLQLADLIAYLQRQRQHPNGLFRANETVELFEVLDQVAAPVRWLK